MASDMNLKPPKIILALIGGEVLAFSAMGIFGLKHNPSPSIPTGWYIRTEESGAQFVEFCPPEPFASLARERTYGDFGFSCRFFRSPFIKRILGRFGDVVTLRPTGILLNDQPVPNSKPLQFDSRGRWMIHYREGRYLIRPDELWVIGDDPRSFDSRYYGPVPKYLVRDYMRAF
jgi:conjugative transfer signal peptidase TraF